MDHDKGLPDNDGVQLSHNTDQNKRDRHYYRVTQKKKKELLKNPTKIKEIKEKKFIDRN